MTGGFVMLAGLATFAGGTAASAQERESRPGVAVLHLGEADVLAGFTPEVRTQPALRDRALALWRSHFAAQADEISRHFAADEDWRPALADAAALLEDFLEASLLPRARAFAADPGHVWVEKLDPATGQRIRTLQPVAPRPLLLAPQDRDKPKKSDQPAVPKPLLPTPINDP